MYTWGKHDECRLGYPATTDQTTPKLVEALKDIKIRQVQSTTTCIMYTSWERAHTRMMLPPPHNRLCVECTTLQL